MTGTRKPKRDKSHVPDTVSAPKRDLRARVAAFLEAHAPEEFSPKFISLKLKGVSHEAVKKAIQRELKDPRSRIVRVREGWYRYAHSIDTFKEVSGARKGSEFTESKSRAFVPLRIRGLSFGRMRILR